MFWLASIIASFRNVLASYAVARAEGEGLQGFTLVVGILWVAVEPAFWQELIRVCEIRWRALVSVSVVKPVELGRSLAYKDGVLKYSHGCLHNRGQYLAAAML